MHWGEEYQNLPNSEQLDLAQFLFENGVNIVLGSHPHVLQRMEKVQVNNGKKESEGFVIYSLGNFVSGQVKENTRNSIVLNLTVTKKGTGEITIDNAKYMPIYTYKSSDSKRRYKVLDIKKAIESYNSGNRYINQGEYDLLSNEYNKIINTVGAEF